MLFKTLCAATPASLVYISPFQTLPLSSLSHLPLSSLFFNSNSPSPPLSISCASIIDDVKIFPTSCCRRNLHRQSAKLLRIVRNFNGSLLWEKALILKGVGLKRHKSTKHFKRDDFVKHEDDKSHSDTDLAEDQSDEIVSGTGYVDPSVYDNLLATLHSRSNSLANKKRVREEKVPSDLAEGENEDVEYPSSYGEDTSEGDGSDEENDGKTNHQGPNVTASTISSFHSHMDYKLSEAEVEDLSARKWKYKWDFPAPGLPNCKWLGTEECFLKDVNQDSGYGLKQKLYKHWVDVYKTSGGHDFDSSRYLDGFAKYYRQNIILSYYLNPDICALFNRQCLNYEGKLKLACEYKGVLPKVLPDVRQIYERFDESSVVDADDARLDYFIKKVFPKIKDTDQGGIMLFICSYFEYIQLRNFLKSQNASFCLVGDYSEQSDISRARLGFFEGKKKIMLYTERRHFYSRYKIRGVKNLIIYSLPERKEFYPEIVNMLKDGSEMTCSVLFCRFDQLRLERIVGSASAKRMIRSEKSVFLFC